LITAYAVFFVLGIVVFLATGRFSLPKRLIIAATIFLLPSIGLTIWVWSIGDEPQPGAVTVGSQPVDN
jgi:hypothetical protein